MRNRFRNATLVTFVFFLVYLQSSCVSDQAAMKGREIRIAGDKSGVVVVFNSGDRMENKKRSLVEESPRQIIDKPVAVFTFINTEVIGLYWFKNKVRMFELRLDKPASIEDRKKLLDGFIADRLITQVAEKEGIDVSEKEIEDGLKQFKIPYEREFGREITEEEFRNAVEAGKEKTGLGWGDLVEELRNKILTDKYVRFAEKNIRHESVAPSEKRIEKYYEENIRMFESPEMVHFNHIFTLTKGLSEADKAIYANRMAEVDAELEKNAPLDRFETISIPGRKGSISTVAENIWRKDNEDIKFTFGSAFFEKVFDVPVGTVSGVLESNLGLHIVQVLAKYPFKVLSLDDKIPPDNLVTVREYITGILGQISYQESEKDKRDAVIDDLLGQTVVKIYEENLKF
jgi:peptidyl-prolyl cis-trans isomerase SurA